MFHSFNSFTAALRKDHILRQSLRRNAVLLTKIIFNVFLGRRYDKLIIINLTEHIGDIVACEPVSFHLRKLHPKAFLVWSVNKRYAELVNHNPNINFVLKLCCLTEWIFLKKIFRPFIKIYDLHINGKRCSRHRISSSNLNNKDINYFNYLDHGNLLTIASKAAGLDDMPGYAPKFHFKNRGESRRIIPNYVVLHTLSSDEERNWSHEKWNELVERMLFKYPEIHIVEIGTENIIQSSSERFHDLTGKLNLQDIASLIDSSMLFIGIESGFGHIANALSKNSVILIGYFHGFKNYMVYSGPFSRGENVSLLYHQGLLQHMEVDAVERAVEKRMSSVLIDV